MTIRMFQTGLLALAGASVVGLGCDRNDAVDRFGPENAPSTRSSPMNALRAGDASAGGRAAWPHGPAVDAIVEARCAREERCNKVGPGREYASTPACLARLREDWHDELNAFECRGGLELDELAECVDAIRAEDCGAPLDTLSRIVACRSGDICNAMGPK